MKRILFVILLLSICSISHAQLCVVDSILLSANNEVYYIYADIDANSENCIYYDMNADHSVIVKPGVAGAPSVTTINNKFIPFLEKAKTKYLEWSIVARERKTTLFSKNIGQISKVNSVFFFRDGQWYDCSAELLSVFRVDAEGNCYIVLETGNLTAKEAISTSSNGFTFVLGQGLFWNSGKKHVIQEKHYTGTSLVFSSIDEVDLFIEKMKAAMDWKRNNLNEGKLFK